MTFRVCHDFSKYQPQKWGRDYIRLFGEQNEGAAVEAETARDAVLKFAAQHRLNPFHLTTK